jgi:tetratricopeptide (TPR) repeat protein
MLGPDMMRLGPDLKPVVTAILLCGTPAQAQGDRLDDLFAALRTAEGNDAEQIVGKIASEWSRSGSPAIDLLLTRGREALEAGETDVAIGHFTALIDHAPDFAEGYNARATAFFSDKQFGPALDDIRMTLALNPRHFGAMTGLAFVLSEIDRPEQALAVWREVARLYPASPEAERALPELEREIGGSAL